MRILDFSKLKWSKAPFGRAWLAPILAATVIGCAWWGQWSETFQLVENRTFDWRSRIRLRFSPVVSDKIVLVTIGDDFWQRKVTVRRSRLTPGEAGVAGWRGETTIFSIPPNPATPDRE